MSREIVTATDLARAQAEPARGRVVVSRGSQTGQDGPLSDLARALPGGGLGEATISITDVDLPTNARKPDDYAARLLKYVPAEVIALYVTLDGVVQAGNAPRTQLLWLVFALGLVATPLYLWRVGSVRKRLQLVIATGAFAVWVLAIGGPFEAIGMNRMYGTLLLPIYTFFVPLFEPQA
jgi:hypothetical protein